MNPELPHSVIFVKGKIVVQPVLASPILTVMKTIHLLQLGYMYCWAVFIFFYLLHFHRAGFCSVCL